MIRYDTIIYDSDTTAIALNPAYFAANKDIILRIVKFH